MWECLPGIYKALSQLSYAGASWAPAAGLEPAPSCLQGDNRPASTRTQPPISAARDARGCGGGDRSDAVYETGDNRKPSTRGGMGSSCEPGTDVEVAAGLTHLAVAGVEPVNADNRLPSTRAAARSKLVSGKRRGWPGRTRTGATLLRGQWLCPAELRAIGGRRRNRTGLFRFAGGSLTTRALDLGCPRLDSNQRSPPPEDGALSAALRGLACQLMDSNHRVFRSAFTVRRLQPLGQAGGEGDRP
jgi:hypothetical protein